MKFRANLMIGGGLVALATIVAVLAPWIALYDPVLDANLMNAEIPPGSEFIFGTDGQGATFIRASSMAPRSRSPSASSRRSPIPSSG